MTDRKLIQSLFIRMCRDSGFGLGPIAAAQLTAAVLHIHPLEIWMAMPSYSAMEEIAAGTHPVLRGHA